MSHRCRYNLVSRKWPLASSSKSSVVPTLGDMMGEAGKNQSGRSGILKGSEPCPVDFASEYSVFEVFDPFPYVSLDQSKRTLMAR